MSTELPPQVRAAKLWAVLKDIGLTPERVAAEVEAAVVVERERGEKGSKP